MRLAVLFSVLWAATCISYVLSVATQPGRFLPPPAAREERRGPHYANGNSSPVPATLNRAELTKTRVARQQTTTAAPLPPGTGGRNFSAGQIFAICFGSVAGLVFLGCGIWICFTPRY